MARTSDAPIPIGWASYRTSVLTGAVEIGPADDGPALERVADS